MLRVSAVGSKDAALTTLEDLLQDEGHTRRRVGTHAIRGQYSAKRETRDRHGADVTTTDELYCQVTKGDTIFLDRPNWVS